MRAIPRFLNDEGREFLPNYFPPGTLLKEIYNLAFEKGASWPVSMEKKTHLIDVAVFKEMTKGYRIFLDYNANPRDFRFQDLKTLWQEIYKREIKNKQGDKERDKSPLHRLEEINPDSIQWLKEYGIDLHAGDKIEIAPSVQHFQGGVKIRERANTSLKGLYAAGECAGGQHGANRPGGNALLDGQVFGRVAGREAALEAKSIKMGKEWSPSQIKAYLAQLKRMASGKKATEVRREVHSIASQFAGVVRTEEGLKEGLKILGRLKREGISPDEKGLIFASETRNLLDVAEMVFRACLLRKESRGPHLFFNHLEDPSPLAFQDPLWRKYIVIQNRLGKMVLKKESPIGLNLT